MADAVPPPPSSSTGQDVLGIVALAAVSVVALAAGVALHGDGRAAAFAVAASTASSLAHMVARLQKGPAA